MERACLRYFKEFYRFIKHILSNNRLIRTLIINDFKKQYLGSFLGLAWAYLQPISFMLVIWYVFEAGLRSLSVKEGVPFFVWLISGMIPWLFIALSLNRGTNAVVDNAFLVKKVAFRVSLLPVVQLGSALLIHFGLLVFLLFVLLYYGFYPSLYWLQLIYYLFSTFILLLGLTWLTSSLRVFIKDISVVIAVMLQLGFWITPIFWSIDRISIEHQYLVKLNPACYITNGYRESLLYEKWFWESPMEMFAFWSMTLFLFVIGAVVFKRLRTHFGDVI